jgi:peroxiredoxin
MKNIVFILLMMCFAFAGNAKVIVKGTLVNDKPATKEIHLLEHDGIALTKIETVPLQENAGNVTFQFELENIEIGFYFIGIDPNNVKYLILGPENEVVITGNCSNLSSAIVTSPLNTEFINIYRQVQGIDGRFNKEVNAIRNARGNATLIQKAEAEMAKIDADRKKLLNETTVKNAFLGNFVGLYTYYSYQNNKKTYSNEIEYFGNEYFGNVNLADPHFNRIPFLYDKVRQYTQTLASVGQPNQVQEAFSNRLLSQVVQGTKAHKAVLAGIMNGYVQGKNTVLFSKYGEQYLKLFGNQNPDIAQSLTQQLAQVKAEVEKAQSTAVGKIAPDFTQNQVDGTAMNLSDLRGKVVLVDFWASWCRPCRKANPEVVALYNKYKDQDFEIIGVSLDRNKGAWEKAIEVDKLTWYHVSDLKGWQNAVAQLYGVRSVPQTFLLDAEGRIIARNLKGPALEAAVKKALTASGQ